MHNLSTEAAPKIDDGVARPWVLGNIPGWVATVITKAVLLLGCRDLHFLRRLGNVGPQWGSTYS